MGRNICCVNDLYFEFSSVVDNIVSPVMPRQAFIDWYLERYTSPANRGTVHKELKIRLKRVDAKGTSSALHKNLAETVANNRAGENGECLTFAEFCQKVLSLATAPPEPEIRFALPAKIIMQRIDGQIERWALYYRENHGTPIEQSKAENYLTAYQSMRELLFGERLDESKL